MRTCVHCTERNTVEPLVSDPHGTGPWSERKKGRITRRARKTPLKLVQNDYAISIKYAYETTTAIKQETSKP